MNVLREAKRDGEMLRRKYPNSVKNVVDLMKFGINSAKEKEHNGFIGHGYYYYKTIRDTKNLLWEFKGLVESNALYDIKRRFSWSQDLQYIFDGRIIDYDDTGNIAYGVIAKAAGISEFVGHVGAGGYNLLEFGMNNGISAAFDQWKKWRSTIGDDPRDYAAIELGYEYYNRL